MTPIELVRPETFRKGGERLKTIRLRRGLSTRSVAELSRRIAAEQACPEFAISHARLIQIENRQSAPSLHKLCALSAIYGVPVVELLSGYVELPALGRMHHTLNASRTHPSLLDEPCESQSPVPFPTRFRLGVRASETNLVSRMVEAWGEVPFGFLADLNLRKHRYGWIGLEDYTMYPLLRPGCFVQIEECREEPRTPQYQTEYDRPVYFLELRDGYLCSWCDFDKGRLISIPHPLSPCRPRQFAVPAEAEVIGRVTGVAMRLADASACPGAGEAGRAASGRAGATLRG